MTVFILVLFNRDQDSIIEGAFSSREIALGVFNKKALSWESEIVGCEIHESTVDEE